MTSHSTGVSSDPSRMPPLMRFLKVGVSLALLAAAASFLNNKSQAAGAGSLIWLSNGLLIGVLLCSPYKQWPVWFGLGALIDFSVNLWLHTPVGISAYLTFCNMTEVFVAARLMYSVIAKDPDLTQPRQLRRFLVAGVLLGPAAASSLAVFGLHEWLGTTFLHGLLFWFAADMLGIATVTPLYLSYHHRHQFSQRSTLETTVLIGLLGAVSILVFGFMSFPMLWLVLLFLILLGARVGFIGSALGLLVVTLLGGYLTVIGHGPITAAFSFSMSSRVLIFQIFILTTMLALYLTEVSMAASTRMRRGLEASENRFRLLAEASRDVIVLAGLDGERKYVSPAATELLGWSQEDLLSGSYVQITHPDDLTDFMAMLRRCREGRETGSLSYRCLKKDGDYLWMESNIRLYRDEETGKPAGFVYILRDISERKNAEAELQEAFHTVEKLAMVDGLTGVANRRLLDETLSREWMRAIRDGTSISLLLIDVDHFKMYNDLYGHVAGDFCLQTVASAIQNVLRRPTDLLARFGGEEFVVVLPNTPGQGAEVISSNILEAIEQCAIPHRGSPHEIVTVSLGCAVASATLATSPTDLLKAADKAMYTAKAKGRNRIQIAGGELVIN